MVGECFVFGCLKLGRRNAFGCLKLGRSIAFECWYVAKTGLEN